MKKILLATDGSAHAQEAAWILSRLPHDDKLEIIVLTVVQAPFVNRSYPVEDLMEAMIQREKASAIEAFEKVKQMFDGANVAIRHELREGQLGETIVKVAKDLSAELVVVGARGRSRVRRILLGSTSDYVATHAHCSVLVVRPTGAHRDERPLRVEIGFEQSGAAQAALEEFADFRWGRSTDVSVVSVASYLYGFADSFDSDAESIDLLKAAVSKAKSTIHDVAPNAKAHLIEGEHIGEELVRFAEDNECDLIVVGETPRGFVGRVVLGSVSRFVLRHAPCSVWITRNRTIEGEEPKRQAAVRRLGAEHQGV